MSTRVEGTFDGRFARLLTTVEGDGWVADTWDSPAERHGGLDFRAGVVFTVAPWAKAGAEPWTPWGSMFAFAVSERPASDPVERFHEALRQEHERARDRLTDGQYETVWAPPHYTGQREGPGRWFTLYAMAAGGQVIGTIWTNDDDGIGILVSDTDAAWRHGNQMHLSLNSGSSTGVPVSRVFNYWAAKATLVLAAGQVQAGDLSSIPDPVTLPPI